ncbi:MAG: YbjN domain-containing protein [bacterium]|nr:YbjN domain-containing protein [bacterium]MCP5040715.1 YbjN domain-containing protein [bacterium]
MNVIHADGRHQLVSFELFENNDRALVRLVSTIGGTRDLRPRQLEQALRANMSLAHGALALHGDELCMTDTLLLEESDPGEIEATVSYLAEMADYYEQILFGTDEH